MNLEDDNQKLRDELKGIVVEALMLPMPASELQDTQILFGPGGLGLDSVDALQLVVALDKHYGIKLSDAEVARQVLASIASMADTVAARRAQSKNAPS